MLKFYLIPIDIVGEYSGPKYFKWRFNPTGIDCHWGYMNYGYVPYGLLCATDITQTDHDALILNSDVYSFPDDLDTSIPASHNDIDIFFEDINLPTNWLTPATTYRELLRNVAGMCQFNQRYGGISGVGASLFDTATLETRVNELSAQEQVWFYAAVESFGINPDLINPNSQLRLLIKQAADIWEEQPFYLGGYEF